MVQLSKSSLASFPAVNVGASMLSCILGLWSGLSVVAGVLCGVLGIVGAPDDGVDVLGVDGMVLDAVLWWDFKGWRC